jgi:hypothetical protein
MTIVGPKGTKVYTFSKWGSDHDSSDAFGFQIVSETVIMKAAQDAIAKVLNEAILGISGDLIAIRHSASGINTN